MIGNSGPETFGIQKSTINFPLYVSGNNIWTQHYEKIDFFIDSYYFLITLYIFSIEYWKHVLRENFGI